MKMDFLSHLQEELNYNIDIKAPFIFKRKKEETKKNNQMIFHIFNWAY
jgi:hypothetical protein